MKAASSSTCCRLTTTNAYLDFIDGAWRTSLYTTNFTDVVYMQSQNGNSVLYGAPMQFGIQTTRSF
jgi:hypothetical protein